jgi:small conductance mechanosensitive channel
MDLKVNISLQDLFQEKLKNALERIKLEEFILAAIHVAMIIGLSIFLTWILRVVLRRMFKRASLDATLHPEESKRIETILRIVRQALTVVIWVVAGLMSLKELGLDVGPLLASAGVVGLAIGFGAQNLVRDIIAGLFIILEGQVRVGDFAEMNGMRGTVEKVSLRSITMRDPHGVVHIIANGVITSVSNHTLKWSAYVFDIGVSYKESTDRVVEVLKAVVDEMEKDPVFGVKIQGGLEMWGVDQFAGSQVMIKGRIKTQAGMHMDVGREFLRRVKYAFDREGIEIPFPQLAVHMVGKSE